MNSPSDDSKSDSECMIDDADDALQFIAPIEQIGEMELCDLVSQLQIPDTPIVAWRHAHSGTGGNEKRQTASDGTKRVLSIIGLFSRFLRIFFCIGKGGFGSVFIAHYNGRKVAIKQLYNRKTEGVFVLFVLFSTSRRYYENQGVQFFGRIKCIWFVASERCENINIYMSIECHTGISFVIFTHYYCAGCI